MTLSRGYNDLLEIKSLTLPMILSWGFLWQCNQRIGLMGKLRQLLIIEQYTSNHKSVPLHSFRQSKDHVDFSCVSLVWVGEHTHVMGFAFASYTLFSVFVFVFLSRYECLDKVCTLSSSLWAVKVWSCLGCKHKLAADCQISPFNRLFFVFFSTDDSQFEMDIWAPVLPPVESY